MEYDKSKVIELNSIRAENFTEEFAPNQKQYSLELIDWLKSHDFDSAEESTEALKQTKLYEGAGIAKTADDILLRIKAMREVGYDDVAQIHEERKEKFDSRGNAYAFSQEWIDDYQRVAEASSKYAERKEVFGKIFGGYVQIKSNPQKEHRESGAKEISKGLKKLQELGVTFEELATQSAYKKLTMATDKGMENFVAYVKEFVAKGENYVDEFDDLAGEQAELGKFLKEHRAEIIEAGKSETWKRANCIAVPSDNPMGYDFIAIREMD